MDDDRPCFKNTANNNQLYKTNEKAKQRKIKCCFTFTKSVSHKKKIKLS